MSTLIVYYSYGGNTKSIAEMIQRELGCNIVEIKTMKPYPSDYNTVVAQGEKEVKSGFKPELQPIVTDLSKYNTVILGTPVWWYTFAPAVRTFLADNSLKGKTIYPFATNGGWIGNTLKDIQAACPDTNIRPGLNLRFDGNTLSSPKANVQKWIDTIKSKEIAG